MAEWGVPGYTELKALGSGGFGDVVVAKHEGSGVLVAIKYLHQDLLGDPGFVAMFRGEAAVLASMDDQNMVRVVLPERDHDGQLLGDRRPRQHRNRLVHRHCVAHWITGRCAAPRGHGAEDGRDKA